MRVFKLRLNSEESFTANSSKWRQDIQILRGIAVLAVLFFHADEALFNLGFLGVDIFFVVSGFVVTPLIMNVFDTSSGRMRKVDNLIQFYKRRFFRLAPAMAACLLFSITIVTLLDYPRNLTNFAKQGISTLFIGGNFGAFNWSGNYFSPNPNPLIHSWSIAVEEQIYVVIPLMLLALFSLTAFTRRKAIFTYAQLTLLSFFMYTQSLVPFFLQSYATGYRTIDYTFYSPLTRFWEFGIGGIVYFLYTSKVLSKRIASFLLIVVTIGAGGALFIDNTRLTLEIKVIATTFITCVVIASRLLENFPKIPSRLLEWVGDRSYTLYLVHLPLLYVAKFSPNLGISNTNSRALQTGIAFLGSFFLADLIHRKIETKYRVLGKKDVSVRVLAKTMMMTFLIPLMIFSSLFYSLKFNAWDIRELAIQPKVSWELNEDCHQLSVTKDPCVKSTDNSKNTVLLLGDSHAGQLTHVISSSSRKSGWNLAVSTQGACPVILTPVKDKKLEQVCLDRNQTILEWVKQNRPEAIIVSQFTTKDLNVNQIKTSIKTLKAFSRNVLWVENIPIFPDSDKYMFAQSLFSRIFSFDVTPRISFPESEMNNSNNLISNELSEYMNTVGVETLSLSDIFCKKGICSRRYDGLWSYWNSNHLSLSGSMLSFTRFTDYLETAKDLESRGM